jgi:hypothetical protein
MIEIGCGRCNEAGSMDAMNVIFSVNDCDEDWRGFEPSWQKGLRDRNSPTCTLNQNGYGDDLCHLKVRSKRLFQY